MPRTKPINTRKRVNVGETAKVSLSRKQQATLEVIATGQDGITVRADDGQQHKVLWQHVHGSVGKHQDPPLVQMVKAILHSADDLKIRECAPPETTEQEVRRKIPADVLARHRRQ